MKTNYKRFAIKTALLLAVVSISSCGKLFEGPAGPKGDTGAAGRDGINGTNGFDGRNGLDGVDGKDGVNGIDGKDGNANVIGSSSFTPTWTNGGTYWYTSLTATGITQSIVDRGVVMVYMKDGSRWVALPVTGWLNDEVFAFNFELNKLNLFCYNTAGTLPNSPVASIFRMVTIAPSNLAKYPDTDWRDYNQVCKVLNLNDNK